jgi:2-hydroxychromene-2-carboxylate isomerase
MVVLLCTRLPPGIPAWDSLCGAARISETRAVPESLTFYFDPMCPYAYQTSLWTREVRSQVGLDITWRFFSLEEVNLVAGKRHPWERSWSFGFGQMRVGALIRRELGNDALDRWYAAIGNAFFFDGVKTHVPTEHARVIAAAGFDAALVDRAVADGSTLDEVREEHQDAVVRYGAHGVPTLVFGGGYAVYGPVVVPAPTGADAVALWELVRGMQRFPQLYELRHPKTMSDLTNVAEHFRTYLTTRDWQTVENPAP